MMMFRASLRAVTATSTSTSNAIARLAGGVRLPLRVAPRALLHTSPLLKEEHATPAPPTAAPESLLRKYGYWSAGALTAVVALSKELLILNEEVLVVGTFTATVYALYTQIGGSVAKYLDERAERIKTEMTSTMDAQIAAIDEQIASSRKMMSLADDVNDLYAYQVELADRYVKAMPNKLKAEMSRQVEKRLALIAERERAVITSMQRGLADASAERVKSIFAEKLSPPEKSKLFAQMLQIVDPTSKTKSDIDPVRNEFAKYFAEFSKRVTQDKGKQIQLTAKEKAAWLESLEDLRSRDPDIKDIEAPVPSTVTLS